MHLTEVERLRNKLWDAKQREIVRAHEDHRATLAPTFRRIERRLHLPAGAIGTTHEVDQEYVVVPRPTPDIDAGPTAEPAGGPSGTADTEAAP